MTIQVLEDSIFEKAWSALNQDSVVVQMVASGGGDALNQFQPMVEAILQGLIGKDLLDQRFTADTFMQVQMIQARAALDVMSDEDMFSMKDFLAGQVEEMESQFADLETYWTEQLAVAVEWEVLPETATVADVKQLFMVKTFGDDSDFVKLLDQGDGITIREAILKRPRMFLLPKS